MSAITNLASIYTTRHVKMTRFILQITLNFVDDLALITHDINPFSVLEGPPSKAVSLPLMLKFLVAKIQPLLVQNCISHVCLYFTMMLELFIK